MQLVQANIWDYAHNLDYLCITTNSILDKNKHLVMGKGIALQARNHLPDLAKDFGQQISERNLNGGVYGLLVSHNKYIAFQTKIHWKDVSPLDVVEKSCDMLDRLARKYPEKSFGLPYPAINNGKRTVAEIQPMLDKLPDNVYVYHLNKLNV